LTDFLGGGGPQNMKIQNFVGKNTKSLFFKIVIWGGQHPPAPPQNDVPAPNLHYGGSRDGTARQSTFNVQNKQIILERNLTMKLI